jgi:uncharacterized protein with HEPN domain
VGRAATDHLRDVLEAIASIRTYTRKGKREFERNPMLRDAVAARLIQIGQAVKDAQSEGLDLSRLAPGTPWPAIAGMRDRLAHKYWQQDTNLVWAVVERDLPELRKVIENLLRAAAR